MVDLRTGRVTSFEEVWKDEEETDGRTVLFMRNISGISGTAWRGRVGKWQLALGGEDDGVFWAWQGENVGGREWVVRNATAGMRSEMSKWLPEHDEIPEWVEGSEVTWEGEQWVVLEKGA